MPTVRPALEGDLESLLELFACAEVSAHAQPIERARAIWAETLASDATDVFVAMEGERVAATCMLITQAEPAAAEKVGSACWRTSSRTRTSAAAATAAQWSRRRYRRHKDKDCFHVLMQSGRQDPAVHQFSPQRSRIPPRTEFLYVVHNPALGDVDALLAVRPPGS